MYPDPECCVTVKEIRTALDFEWGEGSNEIIITGENDVGEESIVIVLTDGARDSLHSLSWEVQETPEFTAEEAPDVEAPIGRTTRFDLETLLT